jgi:glycosyltransferase involved in cell wall biosynthesis
MKAALPVRVLHPITRLIVGGAQENTMYTAALLDKARFQAEILSGPQTGSEGSLIEQVRAMGIPLTILPQLVRQVSPANDLVALVKMTRLMKAKQYAIVHTHSSKAGILGRLAAHLAGVPIIVHSVHGWSFHDYMPPITRRLYLGLERWMASFTHALIVVTERDIHKGLQAGIGRPEQYTLIRSAIPLEQFDPASIDRLSVRIELGIPPEAPLIGNVGRFSQQKNPLDWVRVAGQVARTHPNVYFLLVGDGPLRSQVEAAITMEGIEDRTILTGLRRDVGRMMAAMNIFLLTSLWEGLPRVLPQAMAMKLPVIANRADGTVEIVQHGETGYLCTPGQIDEAAAYCCDLIAQPAKRLSMGQKGAAIATGQFNLHEMIDRIEALYSNLLDLHQ